MKNNYYIYIYLDPRKYGKYEKDFSDIKKEFGKKNFILLTKENEYKNNKQKLECLYKKNNKTYLISFNQLRNWKYTH